MLGLPDAKSRALDMGVHRNYLVLLAATVVSTFIMLYYSDDLAMTMVGFVLFMVVPIITVDFDLAHPYVWFLPVYTVYTIAAPILVYLDYLPYLEGYIVEVRYHYIGAVVFVLVVGSRRYDVKLDKLPFNRNSYGVKAMMLISLAICFTYVFNFVASYDSKYERALSSGPVGFIGFGYYMLVTTVSIIVTQRMISGDEAVSFKGKQKWPNIIVLFFLVFFGLSFLITGERHVFFKLLLVLVIIYHSLGKKLSKTTIITFFTVGILVSSIANQYKLQFITGEWGLDVDQMMKDILYSEFKTVGRNLAILVENVPEYYPFTYGKSMVSDIARASLPGFLFPHFESTATWFNYTFFPSFFRMGGGVGFTLIGACYINFGIPGIAVIMALVSYAIKRLYQKATRSAMAFIVYVNAIHIIAFSIRGDFTALISSLWKHVLLIIFVALAIDRLGARRSSLPGPGLQRP